MTDKKRKPVELARDFSVKMEVKLREKYDEGWTGWDESEHQARFKSNLLMCVSRALGGMKGQWVDVANYAAILDAMEEKRDST